MANLSLNIFGKPGFRIFLKGGITILALLLLGYLAKSLDFENIFETSGFGQNSGVSIWNGPFGFLILASGLMCVGAPRQVISFFAAFFFGLTLGFAVALVATICTCLLSYSVARSFSIFFQDFVKGKLNLALNFWRDNTFLTTIIWRFLPVGNNLLTNLAAGAFKIPPVPFISGSAFGYIPQTLVFAVLGSGVNLGSGVQVLISVALFVVCAVLGLYLFTRYCKELKTEA